MDNNLELHQAVKQKQQQLNFLKDELTELIYRKDHLVFTKKRNLEALYVLKVGKHEYRLMEEECHTARLKRKIALLQAQVNQGKAINLKKIEGILDEEYRQWEQKIREMDAEVKKADQRIKSMMSREDSKLLAKLYRKLVKILHPDLNPNLDSKLKILWQRLQDAYKWGDLDEVKLIDMLANGMEEKELDNQSQLKRLIEKYGQKIRKISDEIVAMLASFPFDMEENLKNPEWIKQKVSESRQKIEEQQKYQQQLKEVIDKLLVIKIVNIKPIEG